MPDRLDELVRQRALVQEHLAWLDREIARAADSSIPSSGDTRALLEAGQPEANRPATTLLPSDAEKILAQHRVAADTVRQDVRKGCFLYFAAALTALALIVAILYFTVGSH